MPTTRLYSPSLISVGIHLVEQSRAGKFRGPDMKKIVSAWIDERLAEVGGG